MDPPASTGAKARPSSLACTECRKHHIKCDAKKPSCSRCTANQATCIFLPSRRGGRRRPLYSARVSPYARSDHEATMQIQLQSVSTPHDDDHSPPCDTPPDIIIPEGRLVCLFYENFHAAHPILVPASLYNQWKYPPYLHQVVKFIGSHYSMVLDNDAFYESTLLTLQQTTERTPHVVQFLILYSIIMCARNDTPQAESSLAQAIGIAMELGMYREDFVTRASGGKEYEAESLRRTWWELFVWETHMATLQKKTTLRCSDVSSDILLPCDESTYASLRTIPQPYSLPSFKMRIFMDDDEIVHYSSFAYRIEAVNILARVLVLNSLPEAHQDHLQTIANSIVSWTHHLPPQKIEIMDKYGNIDEMLFQAHVVIQYAAMLLHLPRSNLRPKFHPSIASICPVTPLRLSPSITRHVHDIKTIEASKMLSNLLSLRSSVQGLGPFVVIGSLLCGLVQLAAIQAHGTECYDYHKNRVILVLGCLKLLKTKWSLAQDAHSYLRDAASEIITQQYSSFENGIPTPPGKLRRNMTADYSAISLSVGNDDATNERFPSRLLSEFLDPTCSDPFLFQVSNAEALPDVLNNELISGL